MEDQQVGGDVRDGNRRVNLPTLISDEFGVALSEARQQIALGSVEVDGEPWTGDKLDLPYEAVVGKEITVIGDSRQFKVTYRG